MPLGSQLPFLQQNSDLEVIKKTAITKTLQNKKLLNYWLASPPWPRFQKDIAEYENTNRKTQANNKITYNS